MDSNGVMEVVTGRGGNYMLEWWHCFISSHPFSKLFYWIDFVRGLNLARILKKRKKRKKEMK
jgi:hypothetical protein